MRIDRHCNTSPWTVWPVSIHPHQSNIVERLTTTAMKLLHVNPISSPVVSRFLRTLSSWLSMSVADVAAFELACSTYSTFSMADFISTVFTGQPASETAILQVPSLTFLEGNLTKLEIWMKDRMNQRIRRNWETFYISFRRYPANHLLTLSRSRH